MNRQFAVVFSCLVALSLLTGCPLQMTSSTSSQPTVTNEVAEPLVVDDSSDSNPVSDTAQTAEVAVDPKWAAHTKNLPFVLGYEAGMKKAEAEGKPQMVFVTTTWCGWCKKLAGENFTDPEVKKLLEENFVLVIVDGDTEKDAKQKFGVRGYPHIIFTSPQGDVLEECRGYRPVDKFKPLVEQALAQVK